MPLTIKIKLLRALSVIQCWLSLWLIVLGIVEIVRVKWRFSGLGMPIWTGVLVCKQIRFLLPGSRYLGELSSKETL